MGTCRTRAIEKSGPLVFSARPGDPPPQSGRPSASPHEPCRNGVRRSRKNDRLENGSRSSCASPSAIAFFLLRFLYNAALAGAWLPRLPVSAAHKPAIHPTQHDARPHTFAARSRARLVLSDRLLLGFPMISADPARAHGLSASLLHARSAPGMPHSALLCRHLCRARKTRGAGQLVQCAGAALQRLDRS